jgi:hypothetical protein
VESIKTCENRQVRCQLSGVGDDRSYTYVEANGALLDVAVGRILGGVEARREVPAADEAAQAAGVHVWQLHDEALRLREPLLHHRRPTTRRDVAHRRP